MDSDIGHVFRKSSILVFYLKGELPGVAEDDYRHLPIYGFQLLQRRKDKDGRFAVP